MNARPSRLAQLAKLVHLGVQYQTGRLCGARSGEITTIHNIQLITCDRCLAQLAQEAR